MRRFSNFRPPAINALHGLRLTLVVLLLSSAYSNAQYATIRPNSDNVARIDVRGTVVNSVTGEPVPHALVTLGGREGHSMLTESDGGFTFEKVPAEDIYLQARRPGFFDKAVTFISPDTAKNLVVKLTPAGLIFGQVVDDDGEPIEGAPVRILQERTILGRKKWRGSISARTNDQGRYRIPNLRSGKYIIAVGPPWIGTREGGKTGYAQVFYPTASDISSATPLPLAAGEQSEADFELSRVPIFKVSGVVTGFKVQGLNVSLTDSFAKEIAFGRTGLTTGEFEVPGVPKGTYTLRARGSLDQGQGGEEVTAQTTVTVNRDVSGIVLVLHPPTVIPVRVRGEFSQSTTADPAHRAPAIGIYANPVTDIESGEYGRLDGPAENGQYMLHLAGSGAYSLQIRSFSDGYVQSATSGNTDLLEDALVVPTSGRVEPIEVVIAPDGAKVRGTVRDSGSAVLVVAVPDSERRQPSVIGCGPQGQFEFQSLAPGDYTFYAVRQSEETDYSDREALKAFRSKAARTTLSANQASEITLDLIETER